MHTTAHPLTAIRERREAAGLSRQALAELARCSMASVEQLERGLQPKRSAVLPRLEQALDELEHDNGDEAKAAE